jgi:superfamily II DNA helicase RecQ
MPLHFFTISMMDSEKEAQKLNVFLSNHKVVQLEKHFVADRENSYWAICVTTANDYPDSSKNKKIRQSIDYKEVLPPDDFTVFAALRSLRKQISESEGVPAYAVFTNEQLAEMVKRRVSSTSEMSEITGIGTARIEKYAKSFLALLAKNLPAEPNI